MRVPLPHLGIDLFNRLIGRYPAPSARPDSRKVQVAATLPTAYDLIGPRPLAMISTGGTAPPTRFGVARDVGWINRVLRPGGVDRAFLLGGRLAAGALATCCIVVGNVHRGNRCIRPCRFGGRARPWKPQWESYSAAARAAGWAKPRNGLISAESPSCTVWCGLSATRWARSSSPPGRGSAFRLFHNLPP